MKTIDGNRFRFRFALLGLFLAVGLLTGGSNVEAACVGGGCETTITGVLYLDADADGKPGLEEPRLAEVTLELLDLEGRLVERVSTDRSGLYRFEVAKADGYWLKAPAKTPEMDLNEQLDRYFLLAEESFAGLQDGIYLDRNTDLGFFLDDVALLADFRGGVNGISTSKGSAGVVTRSLTAGEWSERLKEARLQEPPYRDAEYLESLLIKVEDLLLIEPFKFDREDRIRSAWSVLNPYGYDFSAELRRELLASELNLLDGRGLGNEGVLLHGILAWWGEYAEAYADWVPADEAERALAVLRALNETGIERIQRPGSIDVDGELGLLLPPEGRPIRVPPVGDNPNEIPPVRDVCVKC